MLNTAILMGRLTADPELRHTPSDVAVTSFTLAVDRSYVKSGADRQVDFIDIVAWRSTAEFVCRYFHKGQLVAVQGSIQTRSYTDKEGNKRKAFEVVADNVHFAEPKRDSSYSQAPAQQNAYRQETTEPAAYSTGNTGDFEEVLTETICRFNVNYKDKIRRIIPWLIDRKDPKEITAAAAVKAVRRFAASV